MLKAKKYLEEYRNSISRKEEFWLEKAAEIEWYKNPEQALSEDEKGFYRWFQGGRLNTCYLALDRHVEKGRGDQVALIYDSPLTSRVEKFTYKQLLDKVSRFAGMLKNLGVRKGDRVLIYLPMIPEAVVSMLACARIGAIHSVVFGGFAPHELAVRIDSAEPKVIITASCGIEPGKVIPYLPLIEKAIAQAKYKPCFVLLKQRPQLHAKDGLRTLNLDSELRKAKPVECVEVDATDPLYILYTSGTTGTPKGVIRDNGGHAVALEYSMKTIYDLDPGEVFWAASDVGWVVGHSYIVYGPLIHGCTTILYEGKPVKTPDAGAFWRVIRDHKVNVLFTAPTAIRAIKKEDPQALQPAKYDLSSLKYLFLAGERCDPATLEWSQNALGKPVIDHWWQTESGWPMIANCVGIEMAEVKSGSASLPVPGYDIKILDRSGHELNPNEEGSIAIKLPLPPGNLPTLWKNDERFIAAYLTTFPGYYQSGDVGFKDEDGYIFIMGRDDDVINVSGHRLSTGEMEEMVSSHKDVAECAVVGIQDEMRGQVPLAMVVLKDGTMTSPQDLEKEIVQKIRNDIGPIACLKTVLVVDRLPKTRSGKILRKSLRQMADGEELKMPATIEDPIVIEEIKSDMKDKKVGIAYKNIAV